MSGDVYIKRGEVRTIYIPSSRNIEQQLPQQSNLLNRPSLPENPTNEHLTSVLLAVATLGQVALAKDCAFYFTRGVGDRNKPEFVAQSACGRIGGKADANTNPNGSNSNDDNRCVICRGARSSTKDWDFEDAYYGTYSVRCGYFRAGTCSS